ncbi:hypothetical protein AVEN_75264-1 [Araneus ventricosus]|uniref:Uncharacterized protein n=1 Tax=Araneus ventricosus TaxID=182803 RepID=A0A4Y2US32_ARAVE|nr:hypothetical protein AVEN_113818-1 [Araneus ventricosus]GBO15042.1 hypothetical protein AVEN_75264-1 [Araneus ventricosus]
MKLVSVTQVYLVTKKIEPSLVAVLFLRGLPKISVFSFLAPSFLLPRPPPRGTVQKNLSTNPRPFCKWSPPQRALIGSLPFLGLSFRRQRFLMLEIIDPFHHVH